jgi:hypothetical protein
LRILLLSPRVSGVGGIAQHVRRLARGLRGAGREVELVSIEALGVRLRGFRIPASYVGRLGAVNIKLAPTIR